MNRFEECQAKFQGNPHVQVCLWRCTSPPTAFSYTILFQQPAAKPAADKVCACRALFPPLPLFAALYYLLAQLSHRSFNFTATLSPTLPLLNRPPQQPAPLSQVFAVIEMIKGAKPESASPSQTTPAPFLPCLPTPTLIHEPPPPCFSDCSVRCLHKLACRYHAPLAVACISRLTPHCLAAEAHARSVRGEGEEEGPQLKQGQTQSVRCRCLANTARLSF
jgi:hypothetical protein